MKEENNRKPGGRKLSYDLRVRLFEEVLNLCDKGLSYDEIRMQIFERYGVWLSKSHLSYWVRGIHVPLNESYNRVNLSPSPELAIIAAASVSDGSIEECVDGAFFDVKMKDREPVELIAGCLAKLTGKPEPYHVGKLGDGRYYTEIQSRMLYNYLRDEQNIIYLLHAYPIEFIRMFVESEGGPIGYITKDGSFRGCICAYNTKMQLLYEICN